MERENFTPEELTRGAQNTYSRSMPETGDIPAGGGTPEPPQPPGGAVPPDEFIEIDPESLREFLDRGDIPADMRGFAEQLRNAAGRQRPRQQQQAGVNPRQGRGRAQTVVDNVDPDAAANLQYEPDALSRMRQEQLEGIKKAIIGSLELSAEQGGRYIKSTEVTNIVLGDILRKAEKLHQDSFRKNDPNLLKELEEALHEFGQLENLSDEERVQAANIFEHITALGRVQQIDSPLSEEEAKRTFTFTLTESDFEDIKADPINWMQRQITRIYDFSRQGAEMNSPQVSAAQNLVQTAQRYMILTEWGKKDPEMVTRFGDEFSYRLQVMFQAGTIGGKNMEGAKGLAQNIGTHGLLSTLTFEGGLVNKIHSRMADLYDDLRVSAMDQHITPAIQARVKDMLIKEFQGYLDNGIDIAPVVGSVSDASEERKTKLAMDQIVRAVGAAADTFKAGQREAVIVARGKALDNSITLEGLLADPSALFQAFNMEQMLVAKFGLLNESQEKFYNGLKRRYAENELRNKGIDFDQWANARAALDPTIRYKFDEHGHAVTVGEEGHETPVLYTQKELTKKELEKYGTDLMKDLMLVNDFYSSPWRMKAFFRQIEDVQRYNYVKAAYEAENPDAFRNKRLTKEASEEIARRMEHLDGAQREAIRKSSRDFALFMRLRDIHKDHELKGEKKAAAKRETFEKIAKYKPEDVVKIFRSMGYEGELSGVNAMLEQNGIRVPDTDQGHGGHDEGSQSTITHYDVFKKKYGGMIRLLREKGFGEDIPVQVDLSELLSKPRYLEVFNQAMGVTDGGTTEAQKFVNIMSGLKSFAADSETINKLVTDQRFDGVYSRSYSVDDALLDKIEIVDRAAGLQSLSEITGPGERGGDAYARAFNDAEAAAQAGLGLVKFLRDKSFEDKIKDSLEIAELVSHYGGPGDRARVFRRLGAEMMLMGNVEDNSLGLIYTLLEVEKKPFNKPINELQKIFGIHAPAYNRDDLFHFVHEYEQDLVGSGEEAEKLFHEVERLARVTPKNRFEMLVLKATLFAMLYLMLEASYDFKQGMDAPDLGSGGGGGGGGHH